MGFREQGPCAGEFDPVCSSSHFTPDSCVASGYREGGTADFQGGYEALFCSLCLRRARCVTWLLSTDNPWRGLVDTTRIGAAGHSEGAFTAMWSPTAIR